VLSDKHERSWYDGHRDQILHSGERHQAGGGGGGFTPGQRPDDEVDLFKYFSSGCYSGFGDGPKVRWVFGYMVRVQAYLSHPSVQPMK
jgi:DnaJ family protein A protein 5